MMNNFTTKRSALLAILTCFLVTANAQENKAEADKVGKIYPGFYVTNANDTVQGFILNDDKKGNQHKCRYYSKEQDKKPSREFKPADIKSYKVGDRLYRSLNYTGSATNKGQRFLLVKKDGAITEYVFYPEESGATAKAVFHKRFDFLHFNPVTLSYFTADFAKRFSDYISDYPALSKKVFDKEKGYDVSSLETIIAAYNDWFLVNRKMPGR